MMDYLYLRAWEKMMGSYPYYVEMQLANARAECAPQTAIYRRADGTWALFEQIERQSTRSYVQQIVDKMREVDANGKDNA